MKPVVKDAEDDEEVAYTDEEVAYTSQDQDTDTDRTENEDSASTPSQSRSPSVYAQETDPGVFDGHSFKGRHSVLIDDDEDNSDLGNEADESEEDDEGVSASVSLVSEDVKDRENVADTEGQAAETETLGECEPGPKIPEARPAMLPADVPTVETKPVVEPTQPAQAIEPPAPTKRRSAEVYRPNADSQRSETSSKSGKPPTPPKSPTVPRSSKQAGQRKEKSGIAVLGKHLGGGVTEHEEEDDWELPVPRKSTPSRDGGGRRKPLPLRNGEKTPPTHGGNDRTRGSFFVLLFASAFSPTLCS